MNIDKQTAKRLYPTSEDWFKEQLVDEFGADCFKEESYEKIKTFDDACRACGTTEEEFNKKWNELGLPNDTIFYEKAKIITKAIRGNWEPDWNNGNQRKWWPWFRLSSGFGFGGSGCRCDGSFTDVGSRLCFETEEQSDYAATQFIEVYKNLLT
jgi:hypothetical protein